MSLCKTYCFFRNQIYQIILDNKSKNYEFLFGITIVIWMKKLFFDFAYKCKPLHL
jgi:hypothetical protein